MKLLLFDIDGTLILSGGAATRAVDRAFKKIFGIENAMDGIRPEGKTDPAILREIFQKRIGRDFLSEEADNLFKEYILFLEEEVSNSPGYRIMPGIPKLIEALSKREDSILGIATGNIKEGAWIKLERGGLNPYFKFGGFGSDSEDREELIRIGIERGRKLLNNKRRDIREPFDSAQDRPQSNDERVFVIGDTPLDIIHGRAAGGKTVAVATGSYSTSDLERYDPDYLFESFLDFEGVLKIF
jgi:phosphoglycolate phosphatase-like HAD superfamily hydrolase